MYFLIIYSFLRIFFFIVISVQLYFNCSQCEWKLCYGAVPVVNFPTKVRKAYICARALNVPPGNHSCCNGYVFRINERFCSRALHSADCRGYVLNRQSFKQRMIALPAETELPIKLDTEHDRYNYKLIRKLSPTLQLGVFWNNTSFLRFARGEEHAGKDKKIGRELCRFMSLYSGDSLYYISEFLQMIMFHCFISHLIFVSIRNQF